jgi:hypothetical protein
VSDAAVVLVDVGAVVLVLVELVLVELVLVVLVLVVLVLVVDADASAGRADSPPDVAEVASEDVGGGTIAGAAVLVAASDRAPIPSGEPDGPPLQPAQVASAATSTIADGRTSRT